MAVVLCLAACGDDPEPGDGPSDFGACEELTACGGELSGTWNLTAACTDGLVRLQGAASDEPACAGLIADTRSSGDGMFMFGNATVMSTASISVDMTVRYTPACVSAIAGGAAVDFDAVCSNLDDLYASMPPVTGASCAVAGKSCDCILSVGLPLSLYTNYTSSDSTITVEGGLGSLAYCADGDQLQLGGRIGSGSVLLTLTR